MSTNYVTLFMMKNIYLSLFFIFLNLSVQGQVHIQYEVQSFSGDQITVEAVAYNFDNIISAQYTTNWNPAVLQFESIQDFNLPELGLINFGTNTTNLGELLISWLISNLQGITVPDGTPLYSITFTRLLDIPTEIYIDGTPTAIEFVNGNQQLVEFSTQSTLTYPANITGSVFHDNNEDCTAQEEENRLSNWLVIVSNDEHTFYSITDEAGDFQIATLIGDYELTILSPSDYWGLCDNALNVSISVTDIEEIQEIDLGAFITQECAAMSVDISTPFVRRCFPTTYTVNYCNNGTATAEDAYTQVQIDDFMSVTNTSIPSTDDGNNLYTFALGDVAAEECGAFNITVQVGCGDVLLGQTHCVEAHIFPDTICKEVDPLWSGADLKVTGTCDGDEAVFLIENTGDDMSEQSHYIVSEDAIMYMAEPFILGSGETMEVRKSALGATMRLDVNQVAFHPEMSAPSSVLEGCGVNVNGTFTTGLVNLYSMNDADKFISIDCQENIGAYDPNDKAAYPTGHSAEKYIEANTDLEYKIRFQNTGTDTAFTVVVVDTLSQWLDPATIQAGASSHDYRFDLLGEGVAQFTFSNIMLPDSNVNEAASHGFIKFRIAQQKDNPLETLIENKAAIYFDFNEPVITNTVHHTIGEDFVEIINGTHQIFLPEVKVNFYPNPFVETATIAVEGMKTQQLTLRIYTQSGQLIKTEQMNTAPYTFHRHNMSQGLYFFEILADGVLLSNGKMVMK